MKQAAMCEYQISFYQFSVGPHGFHCKSRVSDLPKHADPFAPKVGLSLPQSYAGKTLGGTEQRGFQRMNAWSPCATKGKQNVFTIPDSREIQNADIRSQIEDAFQMFTRKGVCPY
jgi:hypothetical protein